MPIATGPMAAGTGDGEGFTGEVARLRKSGVLGPSGRLLELFDFLAARGANSDPVSQAELAEAVFGQGGAESDDATVRVYVHRLRKRLDDFYAGPSGEGALGRLSVPAGVYALRFTPGEGDEAPLAGRQRQSLRWLLALVALLLVASFLGGRYFLAGPAPVPVNAIWQPFLESDRPILVVVGDYYIFGEINPFQPDGGRLIRDFDINSPTDLARAQETSPRRYGTAEDVGLNYLPFSSAYGLGALMPILAQHAKPVSIIPASQVTSDTFQDFNVVYVGLVSGMGLLEDVNFMGSGFAVGENYDEIVDTSLDKSYASEEAFNLATPRYYKDYGYLSVFHEPGGSLVAIVAGERDTALRGMAPIVAGTGLPDGLKQMATGNSGFEALFEVTGQQGAALSERVISARARP